MPTSCSRCASEASAPRTPSSSSAARPASPPEIGLAGLKDKDAVTEQWLTVPFAAGPRLAAFSHPAITLGPPAPHGNKLRRGHLHGNRFSLAIRGLAVPGEEASTRVAAKAARLAELGGLDNLYGNQRLGN